MSERDVSTVDTAEVIERAKVKVVRGTAYVLCWTCGMDMCWPSWCKPQRVVTAEQFVDVMRARGKG